MHVIAVLITKYNYSCSLQFFTVRNNVGRSIRVLNMYTGFLWHITFSSGVAELLEIYNSYLRHTVK
jgi:hypothetical protein